jgi:2-oxoglutarate ferredoxin oxidoreductase subunit alpha
LQNKTPEALANTRRLHEKALHNLDRYLHFDYDAQEGADTLLVSWGITARAATEAIAGLRAAGKKVSLLNVKTLLPVSDKIYEIIEKYTKVFIAEENLTGQYREILFGSKCPAHVKGINAIGEMIEPKEIMKEVAHERS